MRIASFLSSATEILYGIGLGEAVVAVSHECDYPPAVAGKPRITRSNIDPRLDSQQIDQQVKQLSHAGQPLYEIDDAVLHQVRPDLIVTQSQCDVCAIRYEDVVRTVGAHKSMADTRIITLNPSSLNDVFDDITRIGDATGHSDAAAQFVSALQSRVVGVQQTASKIDRAHWPRVACIEWIQPLMLAANWTPDLIAMAGGICDLTTPGQHSQYSDWNELVQYDPQVIVVMPCGFDCARAVEEAHVLPQFDGWSELSAVRDGRVFVIDGNAYFNRAGPRLVDSLEILAHFFHPRQFACPQSVANPRHAWSQLHGNDSIQ